MKYCPRCGSPNNGAFCTVCGTQLGAPQNQQTPRNITPPAHKPGVRPTRKPMGKPPVAIKKKQSPALLISFLLMLGSLGVIIGMTFSIKDAILPLRFIGENFTNFSFFRDCHNWIPFKFMENLQGNLDYVVNREVYKAQLSVVERNHFIYYGIAVLMLLIFNSVLGRQIKKSKNILLKFLKLLWNIVILVMLISVILYALDYFLKTSLLFDTFGYILGFIAK